MASKNPPKVSRPIHAAKQRMEAYEPEREVDFSLLTEADKELIRKKAAAKIEARDKAAAEDEFLRLEMEALDKARHPEIHEEERNVTIDLASYAGEIILDGKRFIHGQSYTVKKSVYDVMMDIMQRTYRHDAEIHSGMDANRRRQGSDPNSKVGTPYASISAQSGAVARF